MSTDLEHVLVLSDDVDATRDFYRDVVGLRVGPRPPLGFPGHWLYRAGPGDGDPGRACLHVAERSAYLAHAASIGLSARDDVAHPGGGANAHPGDGANAHPGGGANAHPGGEPIANPGGAIDHLAFGAADYDAALARIQAAGLTPVHNTVPGGPRQLFVHDPGGVRVEINIG
ncbi:MAG: VOC family protein [Solirubrobacteraceae bacterium]